MSLSAMSRRSQTVVSSGFDITTLPSYVAAYSFLLADGKLQKDLSGTAATASGDAIAKILEWSGNGKDFANSNGSEKPLVVTNGIQFDGTDDWIRCAAFNGGSAVSSMTVGFRFSLNSAPASQADGGRLLSMHGSGSNVDYITAPLLAVQHPSNQTALDKIEVYGPGAPSLPDVFPGSVAYGTLCTFIMVFDNSVGGSYVDGGSLNAWNKGGSTYELTSFTISGTDYGSSPPSMGKVPITLRRVAVCTAALGSTDRANMKTWLEA